jgi:MATE family, multidrug efflux pump
MSTLKLREKLHWKRRPFPELVRLAWPIAVSMLSYSVMTLAGTLFVARLGAASLAGIGVGGIFSFSLLCFGVGLLRSVKVLVSQSVGAGRSELAPSYLGAGLLLALGLGIANILAGRLGSGLVAAVVNGEAAGREAQAYLAVRVLAAPSALAAVALRETRYGLGDATSPMRAALAANLLNIALDWLFVLHLGMGTRGAAWATVVAATFETAWLVHLQARGGGARAKLGLDAGALRHVRALWRLGVPIGLQMLLEVGAFGTLTVIVASMSDVDVGAHQIALQVCHFSFLPAFALGEAASVLAGQAAGAGEIRLIRRVARHALWASAVYTGLCGVLFAACASLIARAFTDDPVLVHATVTLLYVAAAFQVFDAVSTIARGVLRGTGDVQYAAVVSVLIAWVCTPPVAYLLGKTAGLGVFGGWLGLCLEIVVSAVLMWRRLEVAGWLPAARRAFRLVPAAS